MLSVFGEEEVVGSWRKWSLSWICRFYVCAKSLQSWPTLCDSIDCQAARLLCPGILQTRILEWVAVPSSRGSSQPRDTALLSLTSPTLAGGFFTTSATWEALQDL